MSEGHKFPECSIWRNGECTCDMHPSTVEKIKRLEDDLLMQDSTTARLKSLVEATETDLFDQKKKRRRLERRWDTLRRVFQLTIDLYEDDEDLDSANVSMSRQALDEMNKLEQG